MNTSRFYIIFCEIKNFLMDNRRVLIGFVALFFASFAIGIAIVYSSYGGVFTRICFHNAKISNVKAFFCFSLAEILAFGIFVFVPFGVVPRILARIPFAVWGGLYGKYAVVLVAIYSIQGILSFVFIYSLYFIKCLILFSVAFVLARNTYASACQCGTAMTSKLCLPIKQPLLRVGLIFLISIILNMIIFLILGLIFPVIVIK